MPFTTLSPLLTKDESIELRKFIINLSEEHPFHEDPHGKKLSLSSNEDEACQLIFANNIIKSIADHVLSKSFLKSVFLRMKSEDVPVCKKFNSTTALKPISFREIDEILGSYGPWRSTLKPLKQSTTGYNDMINNYLMANRLPFMPRMQLSILKPGAFIPPHTDVSDKLVSIMIYLPLNDSQSGVRLGTKFWHEANHGSIVLGTQSESKFDRKWDYGSEYEGTRAEMSYFGYGTTIIFFRTDRSWHSVEIPTNEQYARVSININFLFPTDLNR